MKFILPLLACLSAQADIFGVAHYGDNHASFAGAARNYYWTNCVPWILSHTNDGVFNIAGVVWTGDCFEDNVSITNNYDPSALATNGPIGSGGSAMATIQLTNDARILAQSGLMFHVTDGNHDANNTNGTVGWCHGTPTTLWNDAFVPALWTNQSYFVTNKDAGVYNNMVMKFQRAGLKLKFISYHTEAESYAYPPITYSNQTAWVIQQMRADPDYNCIITAHYFLGQSSNSFYDICPSYKDHNPGYAAYQIGPGNAPIELGILREPNLLGFMSGHNTRLLKGIYTTNAADGHQVFFVQMNQQSQPSRQTSDCIDLLTFDTVNSTVTVRTYIISTRTWLNDYDVNNNFVNTDWPGGFRHNLTVPLPIRPRSHPVWRRQ